MIPVALGEARAEVRDHSRERVAGVETRLGGELRETIRRLRIEHQRVHEILGRVIDADQKTALVALDADNLAVDPEEASPLRLQLHGHLKRRLGALSELLHPAVERDARQRTTESLLEHHREHAIRRQALDVETDGLFYDLVGEPRARPRGLALEREGCAAGDAQEALERFDRSGATGGNAVGLAVALGLKAAAVGAADTSFFPRSAPPIRSFTG